MICFSIRRFALTMRYIGFVKWRAYANCLVVPFLVSVAIFFSSGIFGGSANSDLLTSKSIFRFALILAASFFCVKAIYPTGRVGDDYSQFLSLPASTSEKFIASLIMRIVAPLFCATVGYYASVLVVSPLNFWRVFSSPVFCLGEAFIVDTIPDELGAAMRVGATLFPWALLACSLSFFLFAGVFFSRFKWVLGFVIQAVLTIVLARSVWKLDDIIDFDEYDVNYTALVWWIDGVLLAVAVLLVFLSYHIFKRSQAVKGRFVNAW